MEEYARPATIDDLKTLIQILNRQQVPYLLIGGYALLTHGYARATSDIDIVVPATRDTGMQLKRALEALPDKTIRDLEPSELERFPTIRIVDELVVDILLSACGQTYETLPPMPRRWILMGSL